MGNIVFMSVDRAVTNKYNGRTAYTIRLEFDGNTVAGKEFKQAVQEVNPNIVSETGCAPGYFKVAASSKFAPTVTDADGVELDDIPHWTKGSTGKALMTLKPYNGEKGGSLNLTGVAIFELDLAEGEDTGNAGVDLLKAAIAQLKG